MAHRQAPREVAQHVRHPADALHQLSRNHMHSRNAQYAQRRAYPSRWCAGQTPLVPQACCVARDLEPSLPRSNAQRSKLRYSLVDRRRQSNGRQHHHYSPQLYPAIIKTLRLVRNAISFFSGKEYYPPIASDEHCVLSKTPQLISPCQRPNCPHQIIQYL